MHFNLFFSLSLFSEHHYGGHNNNPYAYGDGYYNDGFKHVFQRQDFLGQLDVEVGDITRKGWLPTIFLSLLTILGSCWGVSCSVSKFGGTTIRG